MFTTVVAMTVSRRADTNLSKNRGDRTLQMASAEKCGLSGATTAALSSAAACRHSRRANSRASTTFARSARSAATSLRIAALSASSAATHS